MAEKRYAIVRVDKFCPRDLERNYKLKCIGSLHCDKCDLKKIYGDTKEQLIRKIAQVIFKNAPKETYHPRYIEQKRKILEVAKKIVEFLGVEK